MVVLKLIYYTLNFTVIIVINFLQLQLNNTPAAVCRNYTWHKLAYINLDRG